MIKFFNISIKASTALFIVITLIFLGVVIYKSFGGPRIYEGYIVDKSVMPPAANQFYPTFIITVQLNNITNVWVVSEAYYNSVHIGDYVRK